MKTTSTKPDLILQMANAFVPDFHVGFSVELAASDGKNQKVPDWIQVFPKGPQINAVDGREFKLSNPDDLSSSLNAKARPLMIDYDHKSHFMPEDGGNQIAAGWMDQFEVRDGVLFAHVEWTAAARSKIENLEYRYISPEFQVDQKTGEILDVSAAALVNRPAFVMQALASAKSKTSTQKKEEPMFKQIALALGLPEDATEEQILAAMQKQGADHKSELAAANAKAKTPSVDDFMPRADYDAVLARATTAEKKLTDAEDEAFKEKVEAAIASAVKAGKITPASKDHYIALCSDEAALKKVLDAVGAAPEIAKGSNIKGKPEGEGESVLTSAEKDMAAALGVSEEDYLKNKDAA